MKILSNNGQIECIRKLAAIENGKQREFVVVSFADQGDHIPEEVAAALENYELKHLQQWLNDREQLKGHLRQQSLPSIVLESLPNMLEEANDALDEIDDMDYEVFKRIKNSLFELERKLNQFHGISSKDNVVIFNKLPRHEALKQQLGYMGKQLHK